MLYLKSAIILTFVMFVCTSCSGSKPVRYAIAEHKTYEASLFRQHCSICHGPEGDGRTLLDGKKVPSLREGELKKITPNEIYQQIADGGNGMTPFRQQLTERELQMLADFVKNELRK